MIQPRTRLGAAALVMSIASCSSAPPKPPEVDESHRRPANSASAVELQVCRGELAAVRAELSEARRLAEGSSAALAQVTVEQLRRVSGAAGPLQQTSDLARSGEANVVWTLHFAFNSSRIEASAEELQPVVDAARSAAYVVVKGRTDGALETQGESTIARRRMAVMYGVLLKGGVDPHKIAVQYQPVGDRVADNDTEEGRASNRRAEVELYSLAPERRVVHAGPAVTAVGAM